MVPRPTLTVDSPIKLFATLATNNWVPSAIVVPTPTLVSSWTIIPFPPLAEYVTRSPVCKLWSLMNNVLVGIIVVVAPVPGFEKKIVLPIPTPAVLPKPTVSDGLK